MGRRTTVVLHTVIYMITNFYRMCDSQPPYIFKPEDHIDSNRTVAFLMGLEPSYRRHIVREHMLQCPTTDMCGFRLLDTDDPDRDCCYQCSCEIPSEPWYNYCPSIVDYEKFSFNDILHVKELEEGCASTGFRDRPDIGIRSVTTCPKNSLESLKNKCYSQYIWEGFYTNFTETAPVTDTLTNITYRNIYCGLCNGISANQLIPWEKINLECDAYHGIDTNFMSKFCNAFFDTDTLDERQKIPCLVLTVTCNKTGDWLIYNATVEGACYSYLAPVRHGNTIFGNVFCAKCNGVDTIQCPDNRNILGSSGIYTPLSFSVFFQREKPSSSSKKCQPEFMFDEKTGCVRAFCSPLRILVDNTCKSVIQTVAVFRYQMTFRIFPLQTITLTEGLLYLRDLILQSMTDLFPQEFKQFDAIGGFNMFVTTPGSSGHTTDLNRTILYFDLSFHIVFEDTHDPDMVLNHLLNFKQKSISVNNETHFISLMHDNKESDLTSVIEKRNRGLSDHFTDLDCGSIYRSPDIVQLQRLSVDGVGKDTMKTLLINYDLCRQMELQFGIKSVRISLLRPCPIVLIYKDDLHWNETATGLVFPYHNVTVPLSNYAYTLSEDTVTICFETYLQFFNNGSSEIRYGRNWTYCILFLIFLFLVDLLKTSWLFC